MTTPAPLPLSEISRRLSQDAERSAVIAAAAESILLANDEAHGELLRAFRNLVDRLIARHGELRSTMAEIEADLAAARLGLMP